MSCVAAGVVNTDSTITSLDTTKRREGKRLDQGQADGIGDGGNDPNPGQVKTEEPQPTAHQ